MKSNFKDAEMDVAEFECIVRIGLGRAVLVLQAEDARPFRHVILSTCLQDLRYDQQVDESRAPYALDLIRHSGATPFFRERILGALEASDQDCDLDQLFELAAMFAKGGDQEARAVIDRQFWDNGDLTAAEHIVALDGLDGILRIAPSIVERNLLGEDEWIASLLIHLAEDQAGTEVVQRELERASRTSPEVASFADIVRREREDQAQEARNRVDVATLSYEQVKRGRAVGELPFSVGLWGKRAAAADLERAARDLVTAQDASEIRFLLSIFVKRAFPLSPEPLITLARSTDETVGRSAWNALAAVAHPAVRALALEFIDSPTWRHKAVSLFVRNYQPGDHALIERALQTERNEMLWHWLGMGALDVFEAHPVPECVPILLTLYETDPCTVCRRRAVLLLDRLGALPSWIIEECRFDANPLLRDLAHKWLGDDTDGGASNHNVG